MRTTLPLLHWEHRDADWAAAAVAGFAAGALLMVLELGWAAFGGSDSPWRVSQLVAALPLGPLRALNAGPGFDPVIVIAALATHYGLGVAFGLVVAGVMAGLRFDGSAARATLVGIVFGAALYVIDFHALTALFPWMVELRGWSTLFAHLVFGVATALMYRRFARPGSRGRA